MTGALDMDRVRFIANDPNSPPEARRHARMILARESGDQSVDMALEASATPITADKPFDWEQPLAEFDTRNKARMRERQDARVQQQLAMENEYEDMRAARGAPMAGSLGESQVVDGVEVPVIEGPAGRPMYRLGDVKAAQAAQREAARVAGVREVNRLDEEQFGYGSEAPNEDQMQARADAQVRSRERANSPMAEKRRIEGLMERFGVTQAQARAAYDNAVGAMDPAPDGNLSLPNVASALEAAATELSGMDGVVDQRAKRKADARDLIRRRAQMQHNPMELLNDPGVSDFYKTVLARRIMGARGDLPGGALDNKQQLGWATLQAQQQADAQKHQAQMAELEARREQAAAAAEQARKDGDRAAEDRARAFDLQMRQLQDRMEAERADRDMKMAEMQQQMEEARAAREAQARQFEERMKAEQDARTTAAEAARADRESRERTEGARTDVERTRWEGMLESQRAQAAAEQKQRDEAAEKLRVRDLVAQYGPGVQDIITYSNFTTPAAQETLAAIARQSDQSMTGFYPSDAVRMDSVLLRLGIEDPVRRRELVRQYGLSPMQAFGVEGRGGPISGIYNFFYGEPQYPTTTP